MCGPALEGQTPHKHVRKTSSRKVSDMTEVVGGQRWLHQQHPGAQNRDHEDHRDDWTAWVSGQNLQRSSRGSRGALLQPGEQTSNMLKH